MKSGRGWVPLFAAALGVRVLILAAWRFDGLSGQDAFAYYQCAHELLQLASAHAPCTDFNWPLGYPILAAVMMAFDGGGAAGAQWASILTGAALAPLAYGVVLESLPHAAPAVRERAAWAAGLLVVACSQATLASLAVMSDAAGLFWASLAVWLVLRWARPAASMRSVWLLPAVAAALSFAIATRWIYIALLAPILAFAAWLMRAPDRRQRQLPASIAVSLALFGMLMGLQLYQNALSSSPIQQHGWVVHWNALDAWRRSFDNPDGHFQYRVPPLVFYASPLFYPSFLAPLLLPCVCAGAWQLRRSPALLLLGGWMMVIYGYLIGIPYENLRFPLAYFMPVAILAGVGLLGQPGHTALRVSLLAVSLAVGAGFTYRDYAQLRAGVDQQSAAIAFVRAAVPPDATVVSFGLSISLEHYTHFTVVDLFGQSPAGMRAKVCGHSAWLFVDRENLRTQWAGHGPETLTEWLETAIGVQSIGSQGVWQLYRLAPCKSTL